MGRCYEFGVSIDDGCEHAMSVVAEGGACECTVCEAHCPGRFAGCAQVVSRPGYIPALAPAWARSGRDAAPPAPELPPARGAARPPLRPETEPGRTGRQLGDVESELAVIRELVEKLLDRPGVDELGGLRAALEERDAELGSVFERFTAAHRDLSLRVDDATAAQVQLADLLGRIDRRLSTIEELLGSKTGVVDWLRRLG